MKRAIILTMLLALGACSTSRERAAVPDGQLEALNPYHWRPEAADYDRAREIIAEVKR